MKRTFTEIISEDEFREVVQENALNFLRIYNFLHRESRPYTRKFYAHLIEEAEELESLLDDHGARDNKAWFFFGELIACVRNIAKAAFILTHLSNRYRTYLVNDDDHLFLEETQKVSSFLDETIVSLYEEIRKESLRLGITFPKGRVKDVFVGGIYPQKRLPYNIDGEEVLDAHKVIAKIANQYYNVIDKSEYFGWHRLEGHFENGNRAIPHIVNEERSRELVALIHNLQSTYDHYIKHTPEESQDEGLKKFRGHISIPLHLLNVVNWLCHLSQRHVLMFTRDDIRHKLSSMLDEDKLVDIIMNFALFYAMRYLQAGKQLAGEILRKYTILDTCEIKVPEKLGFHLRPASLVAKLANHHGTKLSLIIDDKEYDAKSVLNITMAAGLIARKGLRTVLFKGDRRALQDLKLLSQSNFGEDEKGNPTKLPPEFSYLWS